MTANDGKPSQPHDVDPYHVRWNGHNDINSICVGVTQDIISIADAVREHVVKLQYPIRVNFEDGGVTSIHLCKKMLGDDKIDKSTDYGLCEPCGPKRKLEDIIDYIDFLYSIRPTYEASKAYDAKCYEECNHNKPPLEIAEATISPIVVIMGMALMIMFIADILAIGVCTSGQMKCDDKSYIEVHKEIWFNTKRER